jgi:hypothetical protein
MLERSLESRPHVFFTGAHRVHSAFQAASMTAPLRETLPQHRLDRDVRFACSGAGRSG